MSAVALLRKEVEELKKALSVNDWIPEEDGFLGMGYEFLRKLRRDPRHLDGWRYRPQAKAVNSRGRAVRKGIIWSKTYLLSLYVQP